MAWDQSYINTRSNWSYTEPTPPSWGLDYEQEEICRRLEKLEDELEFHQSTLEKSLKKIKTILNQPISTQILNQDQETYQLSQVEIEDTQISHQMLSYNVSH